jgi:plastocyanin
VGTLILLIVAMFLLARPYYRRVRFVARAMAEGSQAVTPEQFDRMLLSGRPWTVAAVGIGGLGLILYFMLFKPTLGLAPETTAAAAPTGPAVRVAAEELSFTTDRLSAPAGKDFRIVFDNRASGIAHNVSVYDDGSAIEQGEIVTGPTTATYGVPPLDPGEYRFVCDVHPDQMTGILVAG